MFHEFITFVRELYDTSDYIPLHSPAFQGNEKKYLLEAIDSTYVSSVGESIGEFESKLAEYTGSAYAIATVNGTSALHLSLLLAGVERNTEVLTQSLTFVATCNAVSYLGADPVFIDIDRSTLNLSPTKLKVFLEEKCEVRSDGSCWNKNTNKKISACLPMHTYGFTAELDLLKIICEEFNIPLVEDAAESLGSFYKGKHTGSIGLLSALSFNGNKVITTGGGGMILTNDEILAKKAKHISTQAKVSHPWEFNHDDLGYNYRMPNLNAALGLAQLENLEVYLKSKKIIAKKYQAWGEKNGVAFKTNNKDADSNFWLNCFFAKNVEERNKFLKETNKSKVMTRPAWNPIHTLPYYSSCLRDDLKDTIWVFDRLVNVPSSPILK